MYDLCSHYMPAILKKMASKAIRTQSPVTMDRPESLLHFLSCHSNQEAFPLLMNDKRALIKNAALHMPFLLNRSAQQLLIKIQKGCINILRLTHSFPCNCVNTKDGILQLSLFYTPMKQRDISINILQPCTFCLLLQKVSIRFRSNPIFLSNIQLSPSQFQVGRVLLQLFLTLFQDF